MGYHVIPPCPQSSGIEYTGASGKRKVQSSPLLSSEPVALLDCTAVRTSQTYNSGELAENADQGHCS